MFSPTVFLFTTVLKVQKIEKVRALRTRLCRISRVKSKGYVVTFLERKACFCAAFKTPNRTAGPRFAAFGKLYESLSEGAVLVAATD